MPVFGRSLFETVLEALDEPATEQDEDMLAPVRGFNGGFVGRDWGAGTETESDPSRLFESFGLDPVTHAPITPAWIGRVSDADIAEDLGLKDGLTEQDLREKRRAFARDNHPDRVHVDYRAQANRRMMIVNQMIDAALARLR